MSNFWSRLRTLVGPALGGRPGRQWTRTLRQVGPAGVPHAEQGVRVQAEGTTLWLDGKAARALRAATDGVATAMAADSVAAQRIVALEADPGRVLRAAEYTRRLAASLGSQLDLSRPVVALWVLAVFELIFGAGEFSFWLQVFSGDIDDAAPLLAGERVVAVILSLLIPVAGIAAARWTGAACQRLLRHPEADRRQRVGQTVAAVAALVLLAAVAVTVGALVNWRYAEAAIFALVTVPGRWMAMVFVSVMLGDALARTFFTSEQHDQNRRRDAAYAADRRAELAAAAAQTRTALAVVHRWTALRTLVDTTMDHVERVVGTGALIVLRERARRGAPATSLIDGRAGETVVPALLDVPGLAVQLRALASAVAVLTACAPPDLSAEAQTERLQALLDVLRGEEQSTGEWSPWVPDSDAPAPARQAIALPSNRNGNAGAVHRE